MPLKALRYFQGTHEGRPRRGRFKGGMKMKSVVITDECISCGACVEICPEVFEMGDDGPAIVRDDADLTLDDGITEAAEECPVEAIEYEE